MDNLIDRKVLLREMETLYNKRAVEATMTDNRACCVSWNDAVYLVTVAPTVEAEPTKHGRWLETPYCAYDDTYKCSVCGEEWEFIEGTPQDNGANYCPNCGARMDEVEE